MVWPFCPVPMLAPCLPVADALGRNKQFGLWKREEKCLEDLYQWCSAAWEWGPARFKVLQLWLGWGLYLLRVIWLKQMVFCLASILPVSAGTGRALQQTQSSPWGFVQMGVGRWISRCIKGFCGVVPTWPKTIWQPGGKAAGWCFGAEELASCSSFSSSLLLEAFFFAWQLILITGLYFSRFVLSGGGDRSCKEYRRSKSMEITAFANSAAFLNCLLKRRQRKC